MQIQSFFMNMHMASYGRIVLDSYENMKIQMDPENFNASA